MLGKPTAYEKWLGIKSQDQPPTLYRLLGVEPLEADLDIISHAADSRMMYLRQFQTGPNAQLAEEILSEISHARVVLLNPGQKSAYDQWLRQQIVDAAPYTGIGVPIDSPLVSAAADSSSIDIASLFSQSPATPPIKPSQRKKASLLPWIVMAIGSAAIALYIACITASSNDEAPTPANKPTTANAPAPAHTAPVSKSALTQLVFDWAESERDGATLEIDGASYIVPKQGPVVRPINSGSHRVVLRRQGYSTIDLTVSLEKNSERRIKPAWTPASEPPSQQEQPQNPVVVDGAAPQKPEPRSSQLAKATVPTPVTTPTQPPAHDADKPPAKAPPPDAAAQQKALKLVNDVYGDKYKNAKTPADIRNLVEEMMRTADETADLTTRFVILQVARHFATQSRQIDLATEIIVKRDRIWVIDVVQEGRPVVEAAASAARLPAEFEIVVRLAADLQKRAVAADDFDQANQSGEIALTAARSAKNNDLQKRVAAKNRDVKERGQEFAQVQTALATLKDAPNDPDANLVLGRYECLTKGEWDKGLPRLAKASDDEWKKLADKELKGATSTDDQVDLGDNWWDLGERKEGLLKRHLQKRAAYWYEKALPGATGLVKDKLVNRLPPRKGGSTASAAATVPAPAPTQSSVKNGPLPEFQVVWKGRDNCYLDVRTLGSATGIILEMRAHNLDHWGRNGLLKADEALNQGTQQIMDQVRGGAFKGKNIRETSRNDQSSDNVLSRTIIYTVEP